MTDIQLERLIEQVARWIAQRCGTHGKLLLWLHLIENEIVKVYAGTRISKKHARNYEPWSDLKEHRIAQIQDIYTDWQPSE